jgi:hypothetical protein
MQDDMTKIIEKMKNAAIGRCRERIELASQRAKERMADGKCCVIKEKEFYTIENHGMTTIFKRRHGL